MKHDPIELLARMAHVHATGEAGETMARGMPLVMALVRSGSEKAL
jgi:hypothetical protein